MLENCTQTTRVLWSKNPIELLYIYIGWNYLRLNRAKFFKFSYISKISMFTLSIGTSPFEVLPLCFRNSHYLKKCKIFPFICWFLHILHKYFTGRVLLWENFYHPETTYFIKKKNSDKAQIPKWAPFAPRGSANQIAGKSWNHCGQYWTLNPMARKPWISHPSVG